MMAPERKLSSERKKGRVPLVVKKIASFKHALNKKKVDVCIINELNAPFPPPAIRGCLWFLAQAEERPFMYIQHGQSW